MTRFWNLAPVFAILASGATAAPITYFEENLSGNLSEVADTRADFESALAPGVGVEDFESPTALPDISFPLSSGTVTASLTGTGTSIESTAGNGRFATSPTNYVETGAGGDFRIDFNSAISAFGFYATDIGDFGNSLVLRLTALGGAVSNLAVGNTLGTDGSTSGSVLFFGFLDLTESYTSIEFLNEPGGEDIFGFDDMIVGDRQQIVNPPAVPLPAGGVLLLAGLGGLGFMRRLKAA